MIDSVSDFYYMPSYRTLYYYGPNVNWSAYEILAKEIETHNVSRKMLNMGSCGLHIVHNAFRNALEATEWKIAKLLSAAYYLFKDSPARREDFTTVTDSNEFPLKFCSHRWVENVTTLKRMLSMLINLRKYINADETKKWPRPKTILPKSEGCYL